LLPVSPFVFHQISRQVSCDSPASFGRHTTDSNQMECIAAFVFSWCISSLALISP
jgi:hypothetical protein